MMARFYQGVGVVTLSTQFCVHIDFIVVGIEGPPNKNCAKVWVIDGGCPAHAPHVDTGV